MDTVDTVDGAAVRIGMTVAAAGSRPGRLVSAVSESGERNEAEGRRVEFRTELGLIYSNLRVGADVGGALPLSGNAQIGFQGVKLVGSGFILEGSERRDLLSRDGIPESRLPRFWAGRDLVQDRRERYVIDLFGLSSEEAKTYPHAYQLLHDRVRPEREQVARKSHRERWWVFGEPRSVFRGARSGLRRFIATTEVAKHRLFLFLDAPDNLIDGSIIGTCLEDAEFLAILSSGIHLCWSLAAGGRMGMGNDPRYNNSRCFDPFPFPDLSSTQSTTLRQLGEELDAHRKERQARHPRLTLTQMYNVLEKLRAGEVIEGKDKQVYDEGLIGLLKDIHDRIDAAVAEAYGWPADLSENDILTNLVALNRERGEEEARGHVRWLRPDYQNPDGRAAETKQGKLEIAATTKAGKAAWPKTLPAQIAAVREVLEDPGEADAETVARTFARGRAKSVEPLLETLAGLGMAEMTEEGRYVV